MKSSIFNRPAFLNELYELSVNQGGEGGGHSGKGMGSREEKKPSLLVFVYIYLPGLYLLTSYCPLAVSV